MDSIEIQFFWLTSLLQQSVESTDILAAAAAEAQIEEKAPEVLVEESVVPIEPEPTAPPTVETNGAPPAEQQFTHIMPNQQFNIDKTKERYYLHFFYSKTHETQQNIKTEIFLSNYYI